MAESSHPSRPRICSTSSGAGSTNIITQKRAAKDISPGNESALHDDEIISLALAWLEPQDLSRVTQVCKRWKDGIVHQYTWKMAAENIKPDALRALETATGKLTSKTMAVGLAKSVTKKARRVPPLPDPTIKAEDIFVLVEMHAFNTTIAWCKNLTDCLDQFDPRHRARVEWDEPSKSFHVPENIAFLGGGSRRVSDDDMFVTATLWRQDTGQFLNLFIRQPIVEQIYPDEIYFFSDEDEIRSLFLQNNYNYLQPDVYMRIETLDETELHVSTVWVDFMFSVGTDECADNNAASPQEFLLFLEGIDWESCSSD